MFSFFMLSFSSFVVFCYMWVIFCRILLVFLTAIYPVASVMRWIMVVTSCFIWDFYEKIVDQFNAEQHNILYCSMGNF